MNDKQRDLLDKSINDDHILAEILIYINQNPSAEIVVITGDYYFLRRLKSLNIKTIDPEDDKYLVFFKTETPKITRRPDLQVLFRNGQDSIEFIKNYTSTTTIPIESLIKLAKLAVVIENWVVENDLDGFAFQCWPSIQDNFGIVPCAVLSMFSEGLVPAACEVDISGLIGMLILQIASDTPSAILDWNNNYGEDPNKIVLFHCSNLPKSFFQDTRMTIHPIIADQKGEEVSFGAIQGRIKTKHCTLLR
ncbi:unnamed protein product, partial [marine sediment metagenome]